MREDKSRNAVGKTDRRERRVERGADNNHGDHHRGYHYAHEYGFTLEVQLCRIICHAKIRTSMLIQ